MCLLCFIIFLIAVGCEIIYEYGGTYKNGLNFIGEY